MESQNIDPFKPTETQIANYWINALYRTRPKMGVLTIASLTNRLQEAIDGGNKTRFEQTEVGATALDESNGNS